MPKKNGKLKICVNFKKLNKVTRKDPYPLPFSNGVFNTIVGYETYLFINGYSRYHHILIALKDRYKIIFIVDWGAFVWMVMPFGVKNGPLIFQKARSKSFGKYLDRFMKIFLDDFTIYSDMESHMMKLNFAFRTIKNINSGLSQRNVPLWLWDVSLSH